MESSSARATEDVIFTKYHVTTVQELHHRYDAATANHYAQQEALTAALVQEEVEERLVDAVAAMREYCDDAVLPLLTRGGGGAVAELRALIEAAPTPTSPLLVRST